jgi:hypothetical protein
MSWVDSIKAPLIRSKKEPLAYLECWVIDKDDQGYLLGAKFVHTHLSSCVGAITTKWDEDVRRLCDDLDASVAMAREIIGTDPLAVPPAWMLERRPEIRTAFRKGKEPQEKPEWRERMQNKQSTPRKPKPDDRPLTERKASFLLGS